MPGVSVRRQLGDGTWHLLPFSLLVCRKYNQDDRRGKRRSTAPTSRDLFLSKAIRLRSRSNSLLVRSGVTIGDRSPRAASWLRDCRDQMGMAHFHLAVATVPAPSHLQSTIDDHHCPRLSARRESRLSKALAPNGISRGVRQAPPPPPSSHRISRRGKSWV